MALARTDADTLFVELADRVDDATWQWHRERGNYACWIAACIKDPEFAAEAETIERNTMPSGDARRRLREAITRRYTLPT